MLRAVLSFSDVIIATVITTDCVFSVCFGLVKMVLRLGLGIAFVRLVLCTVAAGDDLEGGLRHPL